MFLNTSNVPNFSLLILLSFSSLTHPPTPVAGSGRLKVLLSTLLMRNLGRLRCCRGAANVRAPAAAGCGSLLVWLALTSFLSLVILVIVSPSLGSASTTSSCRCSLSGDQVWLWGLASAGSCFGLVVVWGQDGLIL